MTPRYTILFLALSLCFAVSQSLEASTSQESQVDDLAEFSLEQLMEIEVTTLSRRAEPLAKAPAAIYVITSEEIHSSGRNSLPEVLRLAPGVSVGRASPYSWALSARGATSTNANKLEVRMDGRSIYTPLFSGVFWDAQQIGLGDVERIEVIRGPGAVLWGSNAVNGVIDIVTKSARATQGTMMSLTAGTEDRILDVRYGDEMGERGAYRIWGHGFQRDDSEREGVNDDWRLWRAGFRFDQSIGETELIVQGDAYDGRESSVQTLATIQDPLGFDVTEPIDISGGHVMSRWTSPLRAGERRLQVSLDYSERLLPKLFGEERLTFDLDYTEQRDRAVNWQALWGAGYRLSSDEVMDSEIIFWDPNESNLQLFNAFGLVTYDLPSWDMQLQAGVKAEHNDFTGLEIQPNLRLAWDHNGGLTWAAISRAVRTPSRLDYDARLLAVTSAGPPVVAFSLTGGPDFGAEELLSYELGYRHQFANSVVFDLSLFSNEYDSLISLEGPQTPVLEDGALVLPFFFSNQLRGDSHGAELWLSWRQSSRSLIRFKASALDYQLEPRSGSSDQTSAAAAGNEADLQLALEWSVVLTKDIRLHSLARWVDELVAFEIPSYTELDLHLEWSPSEAWSLALIGQNLLHSSHLEFGNNAAGIERAISIRWSWRR